MSFCIVDVTIEIDGVSAKFSSHLAAFEAAMRIRQTDWQPIGGGTYFQKGDSVTFELLRKQHSERAQCP